ncbi:alpha/beta fold hydrolase [Kribbella solani]|uniref:alpha/beta fold hydrolase n=1 Tax=Kribbella solani TaxID=236067 RepID=UPI0029A90F8B|nr:alpha/beta fold hydrolase [Kribbella solani]MDX3004824.1 alpha/beta fold hydrolase [Kribbella solani]
MKRRPLAVVGGGLVLALLGYLVTSAEPVTAAESGINWQQCPDTDVKIDCATVDVPLDWSKPDGDKIHIGIARVKAKDQANRIGVAMMDPGGPGTSGVLDLTRRNGKVFSDAVHERFDVVTYDARGVNTSSRVVCDEALADKADKLLTPQSQADFDKMTAAKIELSEDCRRRTGPLYDHTDNRSVVKDIDAIRAALGEETITQIGYSYGSLAIQQYAEMFPRRVRALVSDGTADRSPKGASLEAWVDDHARILERNFVAFADWCDRTPSCVLYGKDTKKVYGELRERARAGKLTDPTTGDAINFYQLNRLTGGSNYPEDWGRFATRLKGLFDGKASGGTTSAGTAQGTATQAGVPPRLPHEVWFCHDFDFKVKNYAEWNKLVKRTAAKYPNVQWSDHSTHALDCTGYTGKVTNPPRTPKVDKSVKLVVVGNLYDFATVYEGAQALAKQTRAPLLTYEGYGHTIYPTTPSYGPSTCINQAVDNFLINLKKPANTRCPDIETPK